MSVEEFSLFCTRLGEMSSVNSHHHVLFKQVPNFISTTSSVPCLKSVDAPPFHICFHSCTMNCCDRDRLFSASVDLLPRKCFPVAREVGQTRQVAFPSRTRTVNGYLNHNFEFEFRAKIHNIITTVNCSICLVRTSHHTKGYGYQLTRDGGGRKETMISP